MAIRADGKDWTWVVERACPDCGFDPESVDYDEIPHLVRRGAGRWPAVLSRDDAAQRPNETSWSALEYAAHLRDVCEVFRERSNRCSPGMTRRSRIGTRMRPPSTVRTGIRTCDRRPRVGGRRRQNGRGLRRGAGGTAFAERAARRRGEVHRRHPGSVFRSRACPSSMGRGVTENSGRTCSNFAGLWLVSRAQPAM